MFIALQYVAIYILIKFAYLCNKYIFMKETISLRLDEELIEFLKKQAGIDFRSTSNYIEMILLKHKQEVEAKEKPQS